MFKNVFRKCRQNRGFTLMEVMVVVAILAVVVLIAVPSVIKMRQNMKFAERNDYAKSIYMAAQSNLTQMRSMGELGLLENAATTEGKTITDHSGYYYSASKDTPTSYDLIVPSSLDATVRNQQVIVEYHPKAGIVYAVYYHEGDETLTSLYGDATIDLSTEEAQREYEVGYYCVGDVDALEEDALIVYQVESSVSYENGSEGLLTITIPTGLYKDGQNIVLFQEIVGGQNAFLDGLEVSLTFTSESGVSQTIKAKAISTEAEQTMLDYEFDTGTVEGAMSVAYLTFHLDSLANHDTFIKHKSFADIIAATPGDQKIKVGDNVSITADVTFYPGPKDPIVMIESATIAGINPMYHSLTPNPKFDTAPNAQNTEKPYILAISNGRHLQNLSYLDAEFAQNIESIVFTQQAEDPVQPENGSTEGSTSESQPANGAKTSTNTGSQENNTPTDLVLNWQDTVDAYSSTLTFQPIELRDFSYVPSILGNGVKIQNLTVSSAVDGNAGLFAALKNTSVEKITLENPIVNATGATSTGALIGKAENVAISDCDVTTNNPDNTIHYYISGQGDVGGLVGTATGTGSTNTISNCSSDAVVRSANGVESNVGGLVGFSDDTDYTSCNSSAKVTGGTFVDSTANGKSEFCHLGGLVGFAKNATFDNTTSTASVKGTPERDPNGNLLDKTQDNYIGGLIGKADNCTLEANVSATLSDMPSYAYGAGGLVGYMNKGLIKDAGVTLNISDNSKAVEVEHFGGLACYLSGVKMETTGEEEVKVQINGTLYADQAAGAVVGSTNSSDGYIPKLENIHVIVDGSINGIEAAGFAIEAGGKINRCCVIPKSTDSMNINGSTSAAGFVLTNKSDITYSYVLGDVDTDDEGSAAGFALSNHASIKQCFADVSVSDKYAFVKNSNGNSTITNCYSWISRGDFLSPIDDKDTKQKHCFSCYFASRDAAKPYVVLYDNNGNSGDIEYTDALASDWALDLLNGKKDSKTDPKSIWTRTDDYPELRDMPSPDNLPTPTGGNYSYGVLYVENAGAGVYMTDLSGNGNTKFTLDQVGTVSSAEYYVYHRTAANTPSGLGSALPYNTFEGLGLNQLYSIYPVTGDGSVTIKFSDTEQSISMNTHYGPINSDGYYRVRTSDHFKNIKHNTSGNFVLEKDVTVSETITSFSGNLKCSSGTITTTVPLFGTLSGTLTGLDVVATIEADDSAYGIIANTLNGGTLTDCDILDGSKITGSKAAVFVGDAQSGSFKDCDATVESDLPFANFKQVEIDGNPTHYSQHNHFKNVSETVIKEYINGTKYNLNSLPDPTLSPITDNISISNCYINDNLVSTIPLYYYTRSELKCSVPSSPTSVIAMQEITLSYNDFSADSSEFTATEYYFEVKTNEFALLWVKITDNDDDTFDFYYKAEGSNEEKSIRNISDLSTTVGIPLYEKENNVPTDGTFMFFNDGGNSILVYNGSSLEWIAYDVTYSESMIWIAQDGAWKNAGDSNITVSISSQPVNNSTVTVKYDGDTTFECQLYNVTAYKEIRKVDEANSLNQ